MLSAAHVLDQQTRLTERLIRPTPIQADFMRYHMEQSIADNGNLTTMFHPVLPADHRRPVTIANAVEMMHLCAGGLARAITYQVTAEMVAAMRQVFENTWTGPDLIHSAELPAEAGFVWLNEPWRIGTVNPFNVRALSWDYLSVWANEAGTGTPHRYFGCVRVCLWRWHEDLVPGEEKASRELGQLLMTHTAMVPLDLEVIKDSEPFTDAGPRAESFMALLHLLWVFLGTEIVATTPAPIPREFRRRAARTLDHTEVRVVTLRKIRHHDSGDPDAPPSLRDWTCRWAVQGHYRHRERPEDGHHATASGADKVCAVCGQQLAWVRPYLKGPDGLPLRVTEHTVYKLAR